MSCISSCYEACLLLGWKCADNIHVEPLRLQGSLFGAATVLLSYRKIFCIVLCFTIMYFRMLNLAFLVRRRIVWVSNVIYFVDVVKISKKYDMGKQCTTCGTLVHSNGEKVH